MARSRYKAWINVTMLNHHYTIGPLFIHHWHTGIDLNIEYIPGIAHISTLDYNELQWITRYESQLLGIAMHFQWNATVAYSWNSDTCQIWIAKGKQVQQSWYRESNPWTSNLNTCIQTNTLVLIIHSLNSFQHKTSSYYSIIYLQHSFFIHTYVFIPISWLLIHVIVACHRK